MPGTETDTRDEPLDRAELVSHHGKIVHDSAFGTKEHALLGESFTIGTARDNDLVLEDPYVSRHHLRVDRAPGGGYRLRDLGSKNDTYLDGHWTREAELPFGSTIRVGRTELRFLPVEDPVALEPSEARSFGNLVGESLPMRRIFTLLEQVAPSEAAVLFEGETGTGKELAAHAIHANSPRRERETVVVDCSTLHENLAESELFGHERGAFTGANQTRVGAFERADGGTVFLDEVGELPLDRQSLLLRVLEARKYRRVGGDEYRSTDFRVVASTNRDLQADVRKGRFREDLYYRLAVFRIRLPALRERLDDLPLICTRLLRGGEAAADAPCPVSPDALEILRSYRWPGNVRELRNVLERARVLAGGPEIEPRHLVLSAAADGRDAPDWDVPANLPLQEIERHAILKTFQANRGNVNATAKALGIARTTLYDRMKRYGIER